MKHLLLLPLCLLASCDRDEAAAEPENTSAKTSTRVTRDSQGSQRVPDALLKKNPTLQELMQVKDLPTSSEKREAFSLALQSLPPEHHDRAVELVLSDLSSATPSGLLTEYLEISEMLSPALQLPALERYLTIEGLPQLQRVALEGRLREALALPAQEKVTSWRPLIEAHLKKQHGILTEPE